METRRWFNQTQPQTLQSAMILLYLNAALALLTLRSIFSLVVLAGAAAAYGIANEQKWGYYLGLGVAILPLSLDTIGILGFGYKIDLDVDVIIRLMFEILLVALLLHPLSRSYAKLWFK